MFSPTRERHVPVLHALDALNAALLERAHCYFGGATRIVLELGEYRESADLDFLCADRDGYRILRAAVKERSLGAIASTKIKLTREVIADRYGIRTVLDMGGEKIKFEIVLEGRIELSGGNVKGLPVPALDAESCCAEKFLANADRWNDEATLGRDVVDLAFMVARWGPEPLRAGLAIATEAYGKAAAVDAKRAAVKMLERADWRRRCVAALSLSDTRTLLTGLRALAAGRW